MHNTHQDRAALILRDNGWIGMTDQDAFQILRPQMQNTDLMVVNVEEAREWGNLLRAMNSDALALVKQEMSR
jgi:hypothetical protein